MKATALLAIAAMFVLAGCSQGDVRPDVTSGDQPIPIPAADLEWIDLDPEGAPGVKLATLWGDPTSDQFGAFFLLPAGFDGPLHTHTHPMKLVVVSGTYIQEPEGDPVFHLGPGSFLMQPGGDYRHRTSCDTDADCVFFVESGGPFDMFAVEGPEGEDPA
jgi:anti-sigma factor ChrR (cupin superfamily)